MYPTPKQVPQPAGNQGYTSPAPGYNVMPDYSIFCIVKLILILMMLQPFVTFKSHILIWGC